MIHGVSSRSEGQTEKYQAYSILSVFLILCFQHLILADIFLGLFQEQYSLKQTDFSLKHRIWSSNNADAADLKNNNNNKITEKEKKKII